jgi:hypothetical protein
MLKTFLSQTKQGQTPFNRHQEFLEGRHWSCDLLPRGKQKALLLFNFQKDKKEGKKKRL